MNAMVPPPLSLPRAIAHLCASDLRRFHWLVSGVVGIELVRAALVEALLHLAPPTSMQAMPTAGAELVVPLLDLATFLIIAIGTAILVQADHPTDDRAFWRTRPIPPIGMAFGKLATMTLLFVAVPGIVNALRLAAYGAPLGAIAAATLQLVVIAGRVWVPAWLTAILTRTLATFIGAMLGILVAGYTAMILSMPFFPVVRLETERIMVLPVPPLFDWQHTGIHGWWGGVTSTVIGLGLLAAHYPRRRMRTMAAGLLLLVVMPAFVPRASVERPAPVDLARRVDRQLSLPEGLAAMSSSGGSFGTTVHVTGRVDMPELPPDVSAGVRFGRIAVTTGGLPLPAEGQAQCCAGGGPMRLVSATAWDASPVYRQLMGNGSLEVFNVAEAAVGGLRRQPLNLQAEATVTFQRHRVAGAMPLVAGASLATDRYLIEVLALERFGPSVTQALIRFTRFPSMASTTTPRLDLFRTDRARRGAFALLAPWPMAAYNPATTVDNWGQGRRWVGRFVLALDGRDALRPGTDVVVVETTEIGSVITPFAAERVPVVIAPAWTR